MCQQPAGKEEQAWDSVGHPVVEMADSASCTRPVFDREIGRDSYKQSEGAD